MPGLQAMSVVYRSLELLLIDLLRNGGTTQLGRFSTTPLVMITRLFR